MLVRKQATQVADVEDGLQTFQLNATFLKEVAVGCSKGLNRDINVFLRSLVLSEQVDCLVEHTSMHVWYF